MNVIEAMKRSKETGERFRRAAHPAVCCDMTYEHPLGGEDILADDWEPVPGTGDERAVFEWLYSNHVPISQDELVAKFREAAEETEFVPLGPVWPIPNYGPGACVPGGLCVLEKGHIGPCRNQHGTWHSQYVPLEEMTPEQRANHKKELLIVRPMAEAFGGKSFLKYVDEQLCKLDTPEPDIVIEEKP